MKQIDIHEIIALIGCGWWFGRASHDYPVEFHTAVTLVLFFNLFWYLRLANEERPFL